MLTLGRPPLNNTMTSITSLASAFCYLSWWRHWQSSSQSWNFGACRPPTYSIECSWFPTSQYYTSLPYSTEPRCSLLHHPPVLTRRRHDDYDPTALSCCHPIRGSLTQHPLHLLLGVSMYVCRWLLASGRSAVFVD